MGYMRHHAIICTSCLPGYLEEARRVACEIFNGNLVTEMVRGMTNNYHSFCVMPDGSKENWETSNEYDGRRAAFIERLRDQYFADGSAPVVWAEVQFGDDDLKTMCLRSSDHDRRDQYGN